MPRSWEKGPTCVVEEGTAHCQDKEKVVDCPELPPFRPARLVKPGAGKGKPPPEWTCDPLAYYESEGLDTVYIHITELSFHYSCDCGCGVIDPDCGYDSALEPALQAFQVRWRSSRSEPHVLPIAIRPLHHAAARYEREPLDVYSRHLPRGKTATETAVPWTLTVRWSLRTCTPSSTSKSSPCHAPPQPEAECPKTHRRQHAVGCARHLSWVPVHPATSPPTTIAWRTAPAGMRQALLDRSCYCRLLCGDGDECSTGAHNCHLKRGFAGDGVNCTDLGIVATVSPTASITPSISNSRSPTVSETSSSASVSVIASPTHSITPSISESPKSPPSISDGKAVICGFTFKSKWQSCCYRCDAAMFAFFARLICRFMECRPKLEYHSSESLISQGRRRVRLRSCLCKMLQGSMRHLNQNVEKHVKFKFWLSASAILKHWGSMRRFVLP
eukprot:g17847.t1